MLNDVLNAANRYTEGLQNVKQRRQQWKQKAIEIKNHLKEIADYLDANATFKPGFHVDVYHAFIEEINGSCNDLPSVTLRSGEIDIDLIFKNNMGQHTSFAERGFQLTFNPTVTGQVLILLLPHHSDLTDKEPQYINLAVVNNIEQLTMDAVDTIVAKAIEVAFHTSFTGMAEQEAPEAVTRKYTPIGFKKFEPAENHNGAGSTAANN